jgi:hypothetical protein
MVALLTLQADTDFIVHFPGFLIPIPVFNNGIEVADKGGGFEFVPRFRRGGWRG